jgi:hypothetical protein
VNDPEERQTRASDEWALYNSAFLAALIAAASFDYEARRGEAMPWYLPFLVLPLVIARPIRVSLPKRANAYISNWVRTSPIAVLDVPLMARALAPYVREAIRFGARSGILQIQAARISSVLSPSVVAREAAGEAHQIVGAAALVGRWFASEDPEQVFAQFGVRP